MNRTKEQQTAIKYFTGGGGCLSSAVPDSVYNEIVGKKLNELDLRKRALNKIGLDESEIHEIEPINLEGYVFKGSRFQKCGGDGRWRSSKYSSTWIFASDKQLYIYQYIFNTDEDGKVERTEDYFWKDITNFSTMSETYEVGFGWDKKKQDYKGHRNVESQEFAIIVPGDKFRCAAQQSEAVERATQAMKAKLREKKNL